jgi:hypothetical protein
MARIKKFSDYVNEDYSFKGAMQKGKDLFSRAGSWVSSFIQKLKDGIFPSIPEGPKAGAPMVAYITPSGKVSVVDQIRNLYGVSAEESVEAGVNLDNQQIEEAMKDLSYPGKDVININAAELADEVITRYESLVDGGFDKPIFVYGAPGIGKTEIIGQACDALGIDLMTIDLQFMDPADFLGIPSVVDVASDDPRGEGVTRTNPPIWLPRDNGPEGKGGILFFDEMNRAQQPVRTGMMNLAQGRRINTYKLPSNWLIVAAGNRESDDRPGEVEPISTALADRFSIYNYGPTVKGFKDYVTTSETPLKGAMGARAREVVLPELLSFLEYSEDYFHNLDPASPDVKFATPRGWIDASKLLYSKMKRLEKQGKIGNELSAEELKRIFQSEVGFAAANAFVKFYEVVQSIPLADVMKVFDEPEAAPIPKPIQKSTGAGKFDTIYEPDIMFATIAAIVSKSEKMKPLTPEQYSNAIDYSIRLDSAQYGASFVAMLNSKHDYMKTDKAYAINMKKFTTHYFA